MKIVIGDLIEFKWTWYTHEMIRKGTITKVYPPNIDLCGKKGDQHYMIDCSKFQPTHEAFVNEKSILKVNGKKYGNKSS